MDSKFSELIKERASKKDGEGFNHRYELQMLTGSVGHLNHLQGLLGSGMITRSDDLWHTNHESLIYNCLCNLIDYANSQGYNLENLITQREENNGV